MSSTDHPTLPDPPAAAAISAVATGEPSAAGRELVLATIASHAASLLGTARRYSLCADDAQDAYQRALEIFLRRAEAVDPDHAVGWLRTVVKHEALAVRAGRLRLVGAAEVDLDREEAAHLVGAEERATDRELAERAAEALQRLKPQETRALLLKARGYSYREICEITGWTYTKVNRCLTEGRRAFLDRFDQIASGRECARWAPALSALADGEATAEDVAGLRPHLRACAGCRASLRAFRAAPGAVAGLAPLAPTIPGDEPSGLLDRAWDALTAGLHERAVLGAHKLQAGVEAASAGKVAAVAASATALAGGGVTAVERSSPGGKRVARVERKVPAPRTRAASPATSALSVPSPDTGSRQTTASDAEVPRQPPRRTSPAPPPRAEFGPEGETAAAQPSPPPAQTASKGARPAASLDPEPRPPAITSSAAPTSSTTEFSP